MSIESGQQLLHFRLTEKIGEGGMGVVWRAVDTALDREVAIKILPETFAADAERLARFEREAKLLASLNHARIAAVFGLHEADGLRFLSMELIDGEDLARRLTRGPLSLERALNTALQMAEGLEAAHGSGVVHRDLKPANIQLTRGGDVKILDFGLAKALNESAPEVDLSRSPTMTAAATRAGVILGTAAYMSPEQSRGRESDRRTDVWAFGCVLYEMLTGRGVFHAETASDCIARILERQPDWDALPPETPPSVRRLLRRCLEKDARRRLHDMADVRIEIVEALAGRPEEAGAPPEPRPSVGVAKRLGWAAAGLLVGATAAAFLLSRWTPSSNEPSQRPPGRFSVTLPEQAPVVPWLGTFALAISPDGTRLVYVGPEPRSAAGARDPGSADSSSRRTQLYTRRIDEYEVHAIPGTADATSPFFSPDGEWIGFVDSGSGRLMKTRLRGGVAVPLCDFAQRAGDWADDGRIYFTGGSNGIQSVPEEGGAPETLTTPEKVQGEKTRRFPRALPGGKGLLFTLGNSTMNSYDEADIALLDPRTGEHRVLLQGGSVPSYLATGHILYGRDGALQAVPFDLESLQITGAPFTVVEDVVTSEGWGEVQYSVSDNGTLAYVPGGPEIYRFGVYWLDRDGRLEAVPLPPRPYSAAVFSPDGKRLAINSLGANATIWIYEIERRTMTRLTSEWDNVGPIWTHSGSHVTFASAQAGEAVICRIPADGSGPPEVLHGGGTPGSWTPDDRELLFSSVGARTGSDVLLLSFDEGAAVEPLTATAFNEFSPALSPDGRWLAYVSDASGRNELYVRGFRAPGRTWQISAGGGEAPLWSPEGRELYYWKGSRLMAVSVVAGSDFAPGKERELPQPEFDALLNWDIAPDGKRFVVIGRAADSATANRDPSTARNAQFAVRVPEIRVITDWFDELRRGDR